MYTAVFPGQRDQLEEIAQMMRLPFTLVAFEVEDWGRCLTPWPAPAIRKGPDFGGEGTATLQALGRRKRHIWLLENA